jgi:type IV secretion system protein VirB4
MLNKQQEYSKDWQRENSAADFIPYSVQVNSNTVKTKSGDYLQVLKLEGVAHESANIEDVYLWKNQLNIMLRNIASPNVSIWTNIVRKHEGRFPNGEFQGSFDDQLNTKYKDHLENKSMMVNELYLTIIYRPGANKAQSFFSKFERNKEAIKGQQITDIEELEKVVSIVKSSLDIYNPYLLDTYEHNGVLHSEILEFLDFLINGDSIRRALPKKPLQHCLARNRVFFGADSFEVRGITDTKLGAVLGINEYPEGTEPGLINALLSAPFELIITQSFNFLSKPVAVEILQRQQRRMETSEDLAVSQVNQIDDALDDLVSSRFVYGIHHLTLAVFADSHKQLRNNLSDAQAVLADSSMVVSREDWALAAAYWSQLPGNTEYRPRPSPITSLNFAGFSSLHNYPSGRISGNQWGSAVTVFQTSSGAPYYFNFHESLDNQGSKKASSREDSSEIEIEDEAMDGQKALGNTLIIGPSGSGKTVVQGFLMSQSKKFKPTQVIFDKDRGLEIFVRANKGVYLPLLKGERTGFNPFKLEETEENILFLNELVKKLAGGTFTAQQETEISKAIHGVMGLPKEMRKISHCLDFLDPVEQNGTYAKLQKWCGGGSLAWVFDNDEDLLDFENNTMFGFDVTGFIDLKEIRTPMVMYLFHRVEKLIDGRRFMMFLDEFWKLLLDEYFEDLAQNKQKVIRKQNGLMVYGTQSAKDVLKSPIAHTLIEQCATFLFMPNPKADYADYVGGFHLTEREYQLIKEELTPGSRQFLIKQGHQSVIAKLNLKGFDDELAVISGTTDNVTLVNKLIAEHGENPDVWLPLFHQQRN